MAKMHDSGADKRLRASRVYLRPSETDGTRLARWPPPYRARESKPVLMKHEAGEKPKRAERRGWRLTRSLFSEFADD